MAVLQPKTPLKSPLVQGGTLFVGECVSPQCEVKIGTAHMPVSNVLRVDSSSVFERLQYAEFR